MPFRQEFRLIGKHRIDLNQSGMFNFYDIHDQRNGDNRAALIHTSIDEAIAQVGRVLKLYPQEFVSIQQLKVKEISEWEGIDNGRD